MTLRIVQPLLAPPQRFCVLCDRAYSPAGPARCCLFCGVRLTEGGVRSNLRLSAPAVFWPQRRKDAMFGNAAVGGGGTGAGGKGKPKEKAKRAAAEVEEEGEGEEMG